MRRFASKLWTGTLTVLVLTVFVGRAFPAAPSALEVARWQPHDFVFTAKLPEGNPFLIRFAATVRGPDGKTFLMPGFYAGGDTWKVRVSPTAEGQWSLVTTSDLPALDGREDTFTCLRNQNPRVHGGLRVDPAHPHHFVFEDGTRYFLMGYECDWLWALDMNDPSLPTVNAFLDKLTAHGFNYVILNSYAHDTGWRRGTTGDDDFGPPPLYAWEGSNAQPDHSRMKLAYWQHYDRVIEAMYRRGITAHVMLKVYNKMVKWPAKGSVEDDLFFRWLIARYAAYPNIVWDFSKEAHNEKDLNYKLDRFRFIRANDPYHRLVTNHDDDKANDSGAYDAWNDYRADQQHANWRKKILQQRQRRAWPIVNVEFGYEHGPGGMQDKTYGVVQPPAEVCRRAWEVCLAGGYPVYYYTNTAWDVVRTQETPLGYTYFHQLREFFESTRYWELEPAGDVTSAGWCLANPGKEYVVFLQQSQPFSVKLRGVTGSLPAQWYQPLTGQRVRANTRADGEHQLTPPAEWGDGPVALHIGVERPAD